MDKIKQGIVENFIRSFKNAYVTSPQKPLSLALSIEYVREAALAVFYYSQLNRRESKVLKNTIENLNKHTDYGYYFYLFDSYYWGGKAGNQLLLRELHERFDRIPKIRSSLVKAKKKLSLVELILGNLSKQANKIIDSTHCLDTKILIEDLQELSDIYFTIEPTFDFLPEDIEIDSAEQERLKQTQYDDLLVMLEERVAAYQTSYSLLDDSISENSIPLSCWTQFYLLLNQCLQTFRNWITCSSDVSYASISLNRYSYFQSDLQLQLIYDQTENLIKTFKKN